MLKNSILLLNFPQTRKMHFCTKLVWQQIFYQSDSQNLCWAVLLIYPLAARHWSKQVINAEKQSGVLRLKFVKYDHKRNFFGRIWQILIVKYIRSNKFICRVRYLSHPVYVKLSPWRSLPARHCVVCVMKRRGLIDRPDCGCCCCLAINSSPLHRTLTAAF